MYILCYDFYKKKNVIKRKKILNNVYVNFVNINKFTIIHIINTRFREQGFFFVKYEKSGCSKLMRDVKQKYAYIPNLFLIEQNFVMFNNKYYLLLICGSFFLDFLGIQHIWWTISEVFR